ncbi:hypothetical protein MNBD_PLANCTO02-2717 [hydrothermal vent metagenome]|uniref:RNA polymerase sigma-70 region 2 domain-containing protein n=1 Tax=hydrothermal vent metagenome TaxID=652676 RepID=A0A3B1D7Z0_9ZZZZ
MPEFRQQKSDSKSEGTSHDRTEEFIELFTGHSLRIFRFVRSLSVSQVDAEEVYQNVCSVLWVKFPKFQSGTSFWGWSCKIAQFEVLAYRRRQRKQPITFSDEFYQTVAESASKLPTLLDRQLEALSYCFAKLSDHQKELIELRYKEEFSVEQLAVSEERSHNAIYKSLHRIHQSLHDCIRRHIALEEL